MPVQKTCFVIMPIAREGSEDHGHYKALYDELRYAIGPLGYDVKRADEVQKGGAITKDIVLRLAQADLVVADLTNLNPNVFYELGVRHSLRSQGTLMILDETRTADIPFDLSSYRVIKFKGDLAGIGRLRSGLTSFIGGIGGGEIDPRDNPVHDWLPALPANALESSSGSSEGELRERLAKAQQKIREYEETYGVGKGAAERIGSSPLDVIKAALAEANDGFLPSDLLEKAEGSAAKRDKREFLAVVKDILGKITVRLTPREFIRLAGSARNLGFDQVAGAIFDHARKLYPKDGELRSTQLAHFAHSDDPAIRERARQELLSDFGISVKEDRVEMPATLEKSESTLFGTMLDAFHEDDLHEQALKITQAVVDRFPDRTVLLRNHARALQQVGKIDESLSWYQRAIWCPDVNDGSAVWFGNALHNEGRSVDATEVYLLACILDPDDADGFSHLADEISIFIRRNEIQTVLGAQSSARILPEGISASTVEKTIVAALSCATVDQNDLDRCKRAAGRAQIDLNRLSRALAGEPADPSSSRMSVHERLEFASALYSLFRSDLTDRNMTLQKRNAQGARAGGPAVN